MADKKLDNPLADLKSSPARRSQRPLDNPLSQVTPGEVRRAMNRKGKDTTRAGRYLRRSFLIEPDMDEALNQKADSLGVGKMELVRYLLAVGLDHLSQGHEPVKREVITLRLEKPDWRY